MSARVNPTTNELECEMCHGSFVEVVEEVRGAPASCHRRPRPCAEFGYRVLTQLLWCWQATRGDLEGFLHPPPAPPQTAQGWANARDGVMGAEPEPHARDQSRRVDDIRRVRRRDGSSAAAAAVLTCQEEAL